MRPIHNLRWVIAGLLFLATTINYVDRQAISVAAPLISRELGLSATDYSIIVTAFLFAYAAVQVTLLLPRIGEEPA